MGKFVKTEFNQDGIAGGCDLLLSGWRKIGGVLIWASEDITCLATLMSCDTTKHSVCPGYDTKQSDDEVPVMWEFGECGVPLHYLHFQVHSGLEW